jgi:hypothetical protein
VTDVESNDATLRSSFRDDASNVSIGDAGFADWSDDNGVSIPINIHYDTYTTLR